MDKLTAIKIKYNDGTYSDQIPVSVLAGNVEWDSTHTLVDILGNVAIDAKGNIQDQIDQLFNLISKVGTGSGSFPLVKITTSSNVTVPIDVKNDIITSSNVTVPIDVRIDVKEKTE